MTDTAARADDKGVGRENDALTQRWDERGHLHLFERFGRYLAFDRGSGVVSEFDQVSWDLATRIARGEIPSEAMQSAAGSHSPAQLRSALDELTEMYVAGDIFSPDPMPQPAPRASKVSALCLMMAEDCNLRCDYCFAEPGKLGRRKRRMEWDTAQKAVDLLMGDADAKPDVSLSFFGGEPLLNFPLVVKTAEYAKSEAHKRGGSVRLAITTNVTVMNKRIRDFLADNPDLTLILSIDGGEELHDRHRRYANGRGSHRTVQRNIRALVEDERINNRRLSIRGTFINTSALLVRAVTELLELGIPDISVEPAFVKGPPLEFNSRQVEDTKRAYDELAFHCVQKAKKRQPLSFFHFQTAMSRIRFADPMLRPCGAGSGYLAVSSDGILYPCHRFVGNEAYAMGDVAGGAQETRIADLFGGMHVNKHEKCRDCWAKYHCGGGCHCHAVDFNGDIHVPYDVECELHQYRLETSAYIQAELTDGEPESAFRSREDIGSRRPEFDTAFVAGVEDLE